VILLAGWFLPSCVPGRVAGVPESRETASGLQFTYLDRGTGPRIGDGSTLKIHYRAMLEDGSLFDDSGQRAEPLTVRMARNQLIPGLTEGLSMMRQGDRVRLVIPPSLGYGEEGYGPVPPGATLVYEVEVIEVTAPEEGLPEAGSDLKTTESGLAYSILQAGQGAPLEGGMEVTIHYTGWLENGRVFDSSLNRGEPIRFTLGRGMVIPGWEEGLLLLRVGDVARLHVPHHLAYGENGRGEIPPRADLVFELEVIQARDIPRPEPFAVDHLEPLVTGNGLTVFILEEGSGELPSPGNILTVHYSGYLEDGTLFDSSVQRGDPIRFVLGRGQVIAGWDEGFALLRKGARARLIIPPHLAYGERERGPIPPNATLFFDVELIDFH